MSLPDTLALEHLADLHVELEPPLLVPDRRGTRAVFVARGGTLHGPRLRGELLPGGGEWLLLDEAGVGHVDVRVVLRLDDGTLVAMEVAGVVDLGDEGRTRYGRGERIAWDEAYVRTTPRFCAPPGAHAWLNATVVVGVNELEQGSIDYRLFAVR